MSKNINETITLNELVVTPQGASFSSNKTGVQPTTTKYWRIKVKPGDNLTKLANQYNTTVDELVKINNLKDPNSIYAGLDLRVVSREKENKNYASDYIQAVKNIAEVKKIDTRHAAALLDELISQGTVKFDGTPQFIMPSKASTESKVQGYKTKEARERDTRSKDFNFTKTYVANQNAAWKRNPEVMQAFKDAGDATGYGAAAIGLTPYVISGLGKEISAKGTNLLWEGFKYGLQHPIETYIAPRIINYGVNEGFDTYEKNTGNTVSDRTKRNTSAITNMILTPNIFNLARGYIGKRIGSSVIDENTGFIRNYIYNALSNGQNGAAYVGNKATNIARTALPSLIGSGIYLTQDALLDGKSLSQTLQNEGVNEHISNIIDYITNSAIYGISTQAGNRMISKPINNANQLSLGAHNAENAMLNFSKAPKSEFFIIDRPAVVPSKNNLNLYRSYQQIYRMSPSQTIHNFHRKVMPSYAMKGTMNDIKNNAIYYNTYIGNNIKVGQNIGAGHVVKAKVRRGPDANSDDIVFNTASQVMNKESRFGLGQQAIVVERPGSIKLPGLKQMEKEGWVGLSYDSNGNTIAVPITTNFKPKMNGAREDWVTVKNDGSGEAFNANGYQITTIKDPQGNLYHIKIDLGGTGSAAGGSGIISGFADSGQTPMITYQVVPVSKDQSGKYEGAFNRKAASPTLKTSVSEKIKMLFNRKFRKDFKESNKDYKKSEEYKAIQSKLEKDKQIQKKSLQSDVDILQNYN